MILRDILKGIEVVSSEGGLDADISSVGFDSRAVKKGELFVAIKGEASDGHDFISAAIEKGAVAIVCEEFPKEPAGGVTYIKVADSNSALGKAAANFYDNPSGKLKLIGVTGTNGKTTTASLLYDMFEKLGYKSGLISTVVYRIDEKCVESTHTTPDPVRLNAMMAEMVEIGCGYCFMEVSSHSIVQKRIEGLTFAGGVFTNITHDHLDYHKTFPEYIKAKKAFFDALPKGAFALINEDDKNGRVMVQNTKATVRTFSLKGPSDFKGRIIETLFDGMMLNIDGEELWVKFIGRFNAYNLLAVA